MKASMMIAERIRQQIAHGEFRPGDPLPSENDLVEQLGYSKPTVREALRILENEGLIEVKRGQQGGPLVRRLSVDRVARPLGIYLQIGDALVADVWEARDRIVAASVERLPDVDADLTGLTGAVDRLAGLVGDPPRFYPELIEAAETAVAATGSATDHLIVGALRHVIERELAAVTAAVPANLEVAIRAEQDIADSWMRILEHIREGDGPAARDEYLAQAGVILIPLRRLAPQLTVGDALASDLEERVRAHRSAFRSDAQGRTDALVDGGRPASQGRRRREPLRAR